MAFILEQLRMFGMAALVMACAAAGTVGLIKAIEKFALGENRPKKSTEDCKDFNLIFPIIQNSFFSNTENKQGELEMQHDTIRDQMRRGIVEKSVQILRGHGKSDEEIRSLILNDFAIEEKVLDEILSADMK